MKDILEKIGLSEFFAYICPGVVLLASLRLWTEPKKMEETFGEILKKEFLVVVVFLILSYTLGLIVATWSNRGAAFYYRLRGRVRVAQAANILRNIVLWFVSIPNWIPQPKINPSIVENNLRITEDLYRLVRLQGLSSLEIPWDALVIYRTIMADRVGEKGKSVLVEADSVHRRFLFSLGVAMAFFLLTLESLIRVIFHFTHWNNTLPPIPFIWLAVITVLGGLISFSLRVGASRWWEQELILTTSLAELIAALPPV